MNSRGRSGRPEADEREATVMEQAVQSWVDERLAEVAGPLASGPARVGPPDQERTRPWGTVLRIPVAPWFPRSPGSRGDWVWFKATAPATRFEVALTEVLARRRPTAVVAPLAVDTERGWLLLPDGGAPIVETADDPGVALAAAVLEYGELQRAVMGDAGALVQAGVPDVRPATLRRRFGEALHAGRRSIAEVAAASGEPERPDLLELRARLAQVNRRRDELLAPLRVLQRSVLRSSVDHNDLHPGNVLLADGRPRFYDWGDASIAHPFAAVQLPLGYLLHVADDSALFAATRDEYLAGFAGSAAGEDLRVTLDAAVRLAPISRTLTWDRALQSTRDAGEPVDEEGSGARTSGETRAPVPAGAALASPVDREWALAPARTLAGLLDDEPYRAPWR